MQAFNTVGGPTTPRPAGMMPPPTGSLPGPYGAQQPPQGPYGVQQPPNNAPYGAQQPPNGPYGAQQPPYGAQQPPQGPYGAQQPPAGPYGAPPMQQQQPYGTMPPQVGAPYGQQPPPFNAQQNPMGSMGMQQQFGNPPINSYNQMPPNNMQQGYGAPPPMMSGGGYGQQPPMYNNMGGGVPPMMPGGVPGSVSLAKGGNMSLSKAVPNLTSVRIGLGWDVRQTGGPAFDLDASCFLLKGDGRVRMAQDLVFYNNQRSMDGSVFHHGDNLTGVGEGDDEMITIDLMRVPPEIQKIVFSVSIYDAELRHQNFGMVSRAFIRVVEANSNQEICRYDLSEEASMLNSVLFGEVYRYNNEWKFRAVGQGIMGGLKALGAMFGLNLQ